MKPFPEHAKKVFEGVIFDAYQWEQTLYDGSTATFERLRRPDAVVILAVNDGKILIARDEQPHRDPVITLIGGRMDQYGEIPLETAQRELLEETGYTATDWESWRTMSPSNMIDWRIHFFIARRLTLTAKPNPGPGERVTSRWVSFDEFLTVTKDPQFQNTGVALEIYRMSPTELDAFKAWLLG